MGRDAEKQEKMNNTGNAENMDRNAFLINKKIHHYILPGVRMTAAVQLGIVADGMITGSLLGPDALAAIELSMPVLLLLQMPAMILAMGGAAEAEALLAKKEMDKAHGVFTASLAAGAAISLVLEMLTAHLPEVLARQLAGNDHLAALAEPYITVNFAGVPILTTAVIFCYFMNADNHPGLGSALLIIANSVSLVLDVLFLKVFGLGMAGSALSTVTGYLAGMVTVIFYFFSKQRMLSLQKPEEGMLPYIKLAARAGIPGAAFTLMYVLKSVMINSAVVRFLGNECMAVYAVCASTALIAELCVGGFISLVANFAGILYAEKDYNGIRVLCNRALACSYAAISVLFFLLAAFPQGIAAMFGITKGGLLVLCSGALRIFVCSFPFYVYNKFLVSYYQAILQPGLSAAIAVFQGFAVIVPLVFAGMVWDGMTGLCTAVVFSEALTILLSICCRTGGQRAGKFPPEGQYMLPYIKEETYLDFFIENRMEEVNGFRASLSAFCSENRIREKDAKQLGIALEEICAGIVRYGFPDKNQKKNQKKNRKKNPKYNIAVSFVIQDGSYILRIRDDGVPFHPLESKAIQEGEAAGGISLIRRIMSDFQYMRVLNMNNTVIRLKMQKNDCGRGVQRNAKYTAKK